ncbi:hypothetical protein [Megasphaera sp.]|jgi:hypothetical protein|uniref:hypothetical protein n=1 Tax=Megasphaera sp. TaxID=2023260 RepID=UPI0035209364
METIIKILGTYEIITNLIPGILFYLLAPPEFQSLLNVNNFVFLLAFCYFVGLILNRMGSLLISPIAQHVGFVKYAPYDQFLKAEKVEQSKDEHKLQTLLTVNNFYRTLCAMIISLIAVRVYYSPLTCNTFLFQISLNNWIYWGLFLLFLFSYKKQAAFIKNRVESIKEDDFNEPY